MDLETQSHAGEAIQNESFSSDGVDPDSNISITKRIARASVPMIIFNVSLMLVDTISLFFIGQEENRKLMSSLGFGLTFEQAFSSAVAIGIASGFNVYGSQAYGAKNYHQFGIFYQYTLLVQMVALLGTIVFSLFCKPLLIEAGYRHYLAENVNELIIWSIPSFLFMSIYQTNVAYFSCQDRFDLNAYITSMGLPFHVLFCWIFVDLFGLQLAGIGIAKSMTFGILVALQFLYIKIFNPCPQAKLKFRLINFRFFKKYLKDTFVQGSSYYFEWISFEVLTMMVGLFGDTVALAGHSIATNLIVMIANLILGTIIPVTILLGNSVGEGNIKLAKKYMKIGGLIIVTMLTLVTSLVFYFRDQIGYLYIDDPQIVNACSEILFIYTFALIPDYIVNTVGSYLRTLGHENFVMNSFLVCYYGFGLPLSALLGFVLHMSFEGIWGGLVFGVYAMTILVILKFSKLDIRYEITKIWKELTTGDAMTEMSTFLDAQMVQSSHL